MGFPLILVVACSIALHHALIADAFANQPQSSVLRRILLFGSFDYEYHAPNPGNDEPYASNLPSSYPPGTPSGLRGEAIRSALRSDRCLAWNLQGTPLELGVVQVSGPGALTFLNNKLTQSFPKTDRGYLKEASLLTAKGRLVDRVAVAVTNAETAHVVTSPGHTSRALFARLDPFIFPLDQVSLRDCGTTKGSSTLFTLASLSPTHVQTCFDRYIVPKLGDQATKSLYQLPRLGECISIPLNESSDSKLVVLARSELPPCAGVGYTFLFLDTAMGDDIWRFLVSDNCPQGPVEVGALEFETLRIQSGQPAYGLEMTGRDERTAATTPASPLELFLQSTIDSDKGCYLGQEGIASIVKNPRGPPRTLYQVVFDDDFNVYDYQSRGEMGSGSGRDNLTRRPVPGDKLFALGSNEELLVGTITSVAEPGGTGEAETLALALIRRPDGILSQLRAREIEIPTKIRPDEFDNDGGSLLIPPPSLDPLDGLEVIVGGTFTIGTLTMVPGRRRTNLFNDDVPQFVKNLPREDAMNDLVPLTKLNDPAQTTIDTQSAVVDDDEEDALREEELQKAIAEADEAAAEAKRKAEKMDLLRKRAEEAMERRKQKGTQ